MCVVTLSTGFTRTHVLKHDLQLRGYVTRNMGDNTPIRKDPVVFPVRKDTLTFDRMFNVTLEENMAMQMKSTIDWYREEEWKNVTD